jgi:uncharacterized membrane protein YfcA
VATAAGLVLGFLSGLGVGGGSLLILWLTVVLGLPQEAARGINLLFFLPCALTACLFRLKQGTLKMRHCLPAILAGTVSAAVFSVAAGYIDTGILRKPFGILLILTGIRELFYRFRKDR